MNIRIEKLSSPEQYEECELVQKRAWGMEDIEVVPSHILISIQANGGLVLGAYDENDKMVGMLFGLPALRDGKPYHYSHMCGVIPEERFQGIGYELKLKQREHALSQGLDLVAWTFDPLEGANAHFNISKLGVICRTYKRNYYGTIADSLNVGLETDRFLVEWWIRSKRVTERLKGRSGRELKELEARGAKLVNKTVLLPSGSRKSVDHSSQPTAEKVIIEIPQSFQRVKATDMELAKEWRLITRNVFESYFGRGYTVVNFLAENDTEGGRNFYLLQKNYQLE